MKLLLIITSISFLGVITLLSCNKITEEEKQVIIKDFLKKRNDLCAPCIDYTGQPFNTLEVKMLKQMAGGYSGFLRGAKHPIPPIPKDDANNIWFSIESLKHFIWEIESKSCGRNCDANVPRLGVRIYYARYPVTGDGPLGKSKFGDLMAVNPDFSFHHTAFMVPTYDLNGISDRHIDFDPSSSFDQKKCRYPAIDIGDTSTSISINTSRIIALAGAFPITKSSQTTARNHGDLCPPICYVGDAAFGKQ